MYVRHLQQYLEQFTDGRKGNAVSNATIYVQVGGHLEEIRRIEVYFQESNIIGNDSIRVVFKTTKNKLLLADPTVSQSNPEKLHGSRGKTLSKKLRKQHPQYRGIE